MEIKMRKKKFACMNKFNLIQKYFSVHKRQPFCGESLLHLLLAPCEEPHTRKLSFAATTSEWQQEARKNVFQVKADLWSA